MDKPVRDTTSSREDRRKSVRYPITGLVQFQWRASDGRWHDGIGITRDIGKGGVFIESDSVPPIASTIKVIVTLPAESKSNVILQLSGVGYICNLRQESCQTIGFGVSAVFRTAVPKSTETTKDGEK
jgi:hypothetical protein